MVLLNPKDERGKVLLKSLSTQIRSLKQYEKYLEESTKIITIRSDDYMKIEGEEGEEENTRTMVIAGIETDEDLAKALRKMRSQIDKGVHEASIAVIPFLDTMRLRKLIEIYLGDMDIMWKICVNRKQKEDKKEQDKENNQEGE